MSESNDDADSDVESATDLTLYVDGEVQVGCDCCPGPVCSATAPNAPLVRSMTLTTGTEGDYEGWASYEQSKVEWTGSFTFDISDLDPEDAFWFGKYLAEGECQDCDRNVREHSRDEPAWLVNQSVLCPLCSSTPKATLSGASGETVTFLLECPRCRWDRSYEGEDAEWAADLFHTHYYC